MRYVHFIGLSILAGFLFVPFLSLERIYAAQEAWDDTTYASSQDDLLKRADQLELSGRFEEAIELYDSLVHAGGGRDSRWTAYVLFRMGCAQYQLGDRVSAQESISVAVTLDPEEPSYQAFQADVLSGSKGRARSAVYRPVRDSGSAKRLTSTNGILHIFVRGRNSERWDQEEARKAQDSIETSDRWLAARAKESGVSQPPTFVHRFVTLPDEPFWRKTDIPESDSGPRYRKAWMIAILTRFHATSYTELFNRAFEGTETSNRTVVFHALKKGDLFTFFSPHRRQPGDMENTVVLSAKSEWTTLYDSVCYTHGLLHLYGADDLFNKLHDPNVPETDIMNFGAHALEECQLSPLTQYAIGWRDQPPKITKLRIANPGNPVKPKKEPRHESSNS